MSTIYVSTAKPVHVMTLIYPTCKDENWMPTIHVGTAKPVHLMTLICPTCKDENWMPTIYVGFISLSGLYM